MSADRQKMVADRRAARQAKRLRTCRNFTGVMNDACRVGINYATVRDDSASFGERLPCLDAGCKKTCEKYAPHTQAELDAQDAAFEDRIKHISGARAAILATKKPSGRIDCPRCGTKGGLGFSVSSYNGHVHASCSTKDCLRWME